MFLSEPAFFRHIRIYPWRPWYLLPFISITNRYTIIIFQIFCAKFSALVIWRFLSILTSFAIATFTATEFFLVISNYIQYYLIFQFLVTFPAQLQISVPFWERLIQNPSVFFFERFITHFSSFISLFTDVSSIRFPYAPSCILPPFPQVLWRHNPLIPSSSSSTFSPQVQVQIFPKIFFEN